MLPAVLALGLSIAVPVVLMRTSDARIPPIAAPAASKSPAFHAAAPPTRAPHRTTIERHRILPSIVGQTAARTPTPAFISVATPAVPVVANHTRAATPQVHHKPAAPKQHAAPKPKPVPKPTIAPVKTVEAIPAPTAQTQTDAAQKLAHDEAEAAKKAAHDQAEAAKKAAHDQAEAAKKALHDQQEAAKKLAHDQEEAAKKAAHDQAEAAKQAAHDQAKAAHDQQEAAKKAAHDAQEAAKHGGGGKGHGKGRA